MSKAEIEKESFGDLFRVTGTIIARFRFKNSSLDFYNSFFFLLVTYHRHEQLFNNKYPRKCFYASQNRVRKNDSMFRIYGFFINLNGALRVLDRIQTAIQNQEPKQEEIGRSHRISDQTAIMTMESIRVPTTSSSSSDSCCKC